MIRHPYRTKMRLWADSDVLTPVRWFEAPPGAKLVEGAHPFGPAIYDRIGGVPDETPDYSGLGEPWPQPWKRDPGTNSEGYLGLAPCGPPDAWRSGGLHGVHPEIITGPKGRPACCPSASVSASGGYLVGGTGYAKGAVLIGLVGLIGGGGGYAQDGLLFGGTGFVTTIVVTTETGVPSFSGIGTLELDSQGGTLTEPVDGHARYILRPFEDRDRILCDRVFNRPPQQAPPVPDPDASTTVRGYVGLGAQSLGSGPKFFSDKIGIGTTNPLANSALDVRGYGGMYLAGTLSFGGGNFPAGESDGATLSWDATSPFDLSCIVGLAGQGAGHMLGWRIDPVSCKMSLLFRSPGVPSLTFVNTDTGEESNVGGSLLGDSNMLLSGVVFSPD